MCPSRWPRVSCKQSQDNKNYHPTQRSAINRGFAFTSLDYIIRVVHAILEGKSSFHWDFNTSASNLPLSSAPQVTFLSCASKLSIIHTSKQAHGIALPLYYAPEIHVCRKCGSDDIKRNSSIDITPQKSYSFNS